MYASSVVLLSCSLGGQSDKNDKWRWCDNNAKERNRCRLDLDRSMQLRHRRYFQTCHMPAVNTFHLVTNSAFFKTVDNLKLGFSSINLCIVYDLNKIFG